MIMFAPYANAYFKRTEIFKAKTGKSEEFFVHNPNVDEGGVLKENYLEIVRKKMDMY